MKQSRVDEISYSFHLWLGSNLIKFYFAVN
jgi:hypothetical protein